MPSCPNPTPPPLRTAALIALCVLAHSTLTGGRVAVSLTALASGFSTPMVCLLIAVHALLPTLGSIAFGRWVDRAGPRRPVLAGLAATAAGLALSTLSRAPWALWATAALLGGGCAASLLALQSQLGLGTDASQRRRQQSAFALGVGVSSVAGPLLAGQAVAWGGARLAFPLLLGIALLAVGGAVAMRRGLGRWWHAAGSPRRKGLSARQVLDDPALRRVLVADLLIAVAWNANGFIVPVHGVQQGWSPAAVGQLLAAFGGAVLLARSVPPGWLQRFGEWRSIHAALGASTVCFLLFPLADNLPFALALEVVMGLGLGSSLPGVLALLFAASPPGRQGEVLGVRAVVLNLCAIAMPVLLGGLGATVGVGRLLAGLGVGLAGGAAAFGRPSFTDGRRA